MRRIGRAIANWLWSHGIFREWAEEYLCLEDGGTYEDYLDECRAMYDDCTAYTGK